MLPIYKLRVIDLLLFKDFFSSNESFNDDLGFSDGETETKKVGRAVLGLENIMELPE